MIFFIPLLVCAPRLFWGGHGASWHVAIYIGNGQYVAAPAPGYNVRVENVTTGFMPDFVGSYNA
ncbi:C40 family peptidase [Weissella confusa]|uniref:C40 family peptidase n=1 Tax=Weissella confusa TaxID=1583 RepID=A0A923NGP1_WEICO|nr:C40 family peptidase [Weissella confusa]